MLILSALPGSFRRLEDLWFRGCDASRSKRKAMCRSQDRKSRFQFAFQIQTLGELPSPEQPSANIKVNPSVDPVEHVTSERLGRLLMITAFSFFINRSGKLPLYLCDNRIPRHFATINIKGKSHQVENSRRFEFLHRRFYFGPIPEIAESGLTRSTGVDGWPYAQKSAENVMIHS